MSSKHSQRTWGGDRLDSLSDETLENVELVEDQLRNLITTEDIEYLTSKLIAEDLSVSPQQVGMYLPKIDTRDNEFTVTKWSSGTNTPYRWRIHRGESE